MNKNLIALAVAGAFALPLAVSADTGNVVIYGKADIALDNVNPGSTTTASGNKRSRVTSGNSLLGFKGTEDLGNGLSAVFQFEQNVALDNGVAPGTTGSGATTFNRASFAGLSSATMGAVTLGIQDSPYKTATSGKLDPFADTIGDYNAIFTRDIRAANSVKYVSPNFSGFSVAALWAAANETLPNTGSAKNDGKFQSINGVYENGPIYVALAHERAQLVNIASDAANPKYKATKLGGSYAFGDTKVGAIWEKYTDNATDFSNATVTTDDDQNRRTNWTLNVTHKIGATTLKAAYVKAGKKESVDNSDAKQWTLGASYAFSKRTEAYALYTRMDNRDGSSFGIGQGGTALAASGAGADPKGMALGLKHLF